MYGEDDEWCLRITTAGWKLMFEPAAAVLHHGGQLSLQRWDASQRLRVRLNSSFDFQRRCLPRWRVMTNLLAGCGVMTAQRVWRKLRRLPTDDVKITQQMYSIELKRALKRNHS